MSLIENKLLFIAFICLCLSYFSDYIQIFIFLISIFYLFFRYRKYSIVSICILCCFMFCLHNYVHNEMPSDCVKVIDIRSNYVIASDGINKVLLYNVEDVNLHDSIRVHGTYEEIVSTMNEGTFNFSEYCHHKNIFYSMYVTNYRLKHVSYSPLAILYRFINSYSDLHKSLLKQVIYRINSDDLEQDSFIYASGMHISILILLLSKVLNKEYHSTSIVVSCLYLFLFPSNYFIYRICIFSLIEKLSNLNNKDKLGLKTILLFFLFPYSIYELSFIIPFLFHLISLFNISKIQRKITSCIVLIPVLLNTYFEVNILQIVFFSYFRILYGMIYILTLFSIIIKPVYKIVLFFIHIISYINKINIPFTVIIGKPYIIWILLWIVLSYYLLKEKKLKYYVGFLLLMLFQYNIKNLNPTYEITYLDVGQGDSILIREPYNGKVMMIDVCGKVNKNIPETNIYPYLKKEGIKSIDYVVLTHDDYDHSGGYDDLSDLIEIKNKITEKQDIKLKYSKFYSISNKSYEESNDNSIVLYTKIFNKSFIFMGDASKTTEKDILKEYGNLKADVIKVGHHGSNTSSLPLFIHTLNATYGIISAGRNNSYGHPHEETLDTLNNEHIQILNTQNNGSISFYFLKDIKYIKTGNNEIYKMR